MITVHTRKGRVIEYPNWPAMRDDKDLADDEPLKAVYVDFEITLKQRNHVVMYLTEKPHV